MGIGAASAATVAAYAGAATAVIGTGVSVAGAMQQGQAQKAASDYQVQVARNNQVVAQQNAQAVQDQAAVKAQATQRMGDIKLGAQRAAMGASGVGLDSGSALDVTGSTAQQTSLATANDGYQGQLAAYGYQNQANNFGSQAGMAAAAGENASSAGTVNAFSTFLSGASQVAGKWNGWRTTTDPWGGAGVPN